MKGMCILSLVYLITSFSLLQGENETNTSPNPYGSLSELPQDEGSDQMPNRSPYGNLSELPPE